MSFEKMKLYDGLDCQESRLDIGSSLVAQKSHISFTQYYSQSKVLPASESGIYKSNRLKEELQELVNYFSQFKSTRVHTPCDQKCLLLSINSIIFHFGLKDNHLLCGTISLRDKKALVSFTGSKLMCIEYFGSNRILLCNKEGQVFLYYLEIEFNSTRVIDFKLSFGKEIVTKGNRIKALKASLDQDCFYTLENVNGKAFVYQWSNFEPSNIFSFDSRGLCMDISLDDVYIVTGHENCTLVLFSKEKNATEMIRNEKAGKISCVKINKTCTFIVYSGNSSMIFIERMFDLGNPQQISCFSLKIRCLVLAEDENVLVSGGCDGKIYVWDLSGNVEGFALADLSVSTKINSTVTVTSLILDKAGVVHSYSSDGVINSLKIPNLNQYYILNTHEKIEKIDFMFGKIRGVDSNEQAINETDSLFVLCESNLLNIGIFDSSIGYSKNFEYKRILAVTADIESGVLCIVCPKNKENSFSAILYNFTTNESIASIDFELINFENISFSFKNGFIAPYGDYQYKVIHFNNATQHIIVHKGKITALTISVSQKLIFSGEQSGLVMVHKLLDDGSLVGLKTLIENNFKVLNLWIEPNGVYLIVSHENNLVNIWEVRKGFKINSTSQEGLIDIIFPMNTSLMFCLTSSSLTAYHLPSLISYFSITFTSPPQRFCFVQNQESIAIYMSKNIYIYKNPVKTSEILPFGDLKNISTFYDKIIKLIKGKLPNHESVLNNWYISPFGANIIHLYAYLDNPQHIEQALDDKVGFFPTKSGGTPLDIALDLVYEDCLDLLLERFQDFDPLLLWVLESSLIRLNLCPYFEVFKFYELFMLKSIDKTLPKFYKSNRELPIIVTTSQILAENENFMTKEEISLEGTEIMFKQTFMRVNMVPGSRDSILLARSIGETTNGDLFTTEFFKTLLEEKWKRIRLILYCQAFVYMFYLAMISLFGIFKLHWLFLMAFSINILLIAYELIQLITSPVDYFRDKYNWNDLARSFTNCYYFGKIYLGYPLNREEVAILIILTWFKALSYFRLFESTRYFINLLFAVCADIIPFLSFLLTVTIAMSIIYTVLLNSGEGYYHFLKLTWEVNIGNFDTSDFGYFMYCVFFLHTIVIAIMLLNLLISIMSDTFEKVNSQLAWADGKELITMIIEGENFMFWNRSLNYKEFVHCCVRKLRGINRDQGFDRLRMKVKQIQEQNNEILHKIDEGMKNINQRLDKLCVS